MSEKSKEDLLAEYGELSLKMETAQRQVQQLQQMMLGVKGELQNVLKDEQEKKKEEK